MACAVRWGSSLRRDRLRSVVDGDADGVDNVDYIDNIVGKCRIGMIVIVMML